MRLPSNNHLLLPSSTFYHLLFTFFLCVSFPPIVFFFTFTLPLCPLSVYHSLLPLLHPFSPSFFTPALSSSPSHLVTCAQLTNLNFFLLHMQRKTKCRSVLKTSLDNDNSKGVTVFCEVLTLHTATVNPFYQCNGHMRG